MAFLLAQAFPSEPQTLHLFWLPPLNCSLGPALSLPAGRGQTYPEVLRSRGMSLLRAQGVLPLEATGHTLQAQRLAGWTHAREGAQPLLRSWIPKSWSQGGAGRICHAGVPLSWRRARPTFDFSVPVKQVPWAQAVGTSGAGRCLDSRLPDLPDRMWLSLGQSHNPAPPLHIPLPPRLLPLGIGRKAFQPEAPVRGGPSEGRGGGSVRTASISQGQPTLI